MRLSRWPDCCQCAARLALDRARQILYCANPSCPAYDPPHPGRGVVLVWENQHLDWLQQWPRLASV